MKFWGSFITKQQASAIPFGEKMTVKYEFKGKQYRSLAACIRENKDQVTVTSSTVAYRLKKGWTLKNAMLTPKQQTFVSHLGSHVVEGVEYPNLPSIAKEYGINMNSVYKRYARGHRGDDLVPPRKRKSFVEEESIVNLRFVAGGVRYKSAAEACRELGVKYVTYRHRLDRGQTIEQALEIDSPPDGRFGCKVYDVDGEKFTMAELSEKFGIPVSTIRCRLSRGASVRQAIALDPIKRGELLKQREVKRKYKTNIELIVKGKKYKSYKQLADEFGLKDFVVRQRIVDYGYTPEEAVTLQGKGLPVHIEGKEYSCKAEAARAYGISPAVLLARLNRGHTLEQAVGLDPVITSRTVEFQGETYPSLAAVAENFGMAAGTLHGRLKMGRSLEEAISLGSGRIKGPGRINQTILDRDEAQATKPAHLYFASLNIGGKKKYKIGITTRAAEERLKQVQYKFSILSLVPGTLKECFELEQNLFEMLWDKQDESISSEMMDGYSEVFDLSDDDVEVVIDLLD